MPLIANAATTTTATTSEQYQFYDQRTRDQQVSVNKVWDDGLTNNTRVLNTTDTPSAYEDNLSMTIQTGVPQTVLRTYAITYDANGGTYGTDTNGNAITINTITYNAKNQPTNGAYAMPERTDGYTCIGWSTNKTATNPDITITNTATDKWMNERTDGSTITLYAVWKDISVHYAVMAYGIGVDKDANGNTMGITFGPALGFPAFSPYNGDTHVVSEQPFTKSHSVRGDATVMSENDPACTDTTHSVITGTDAGTDAAGNAYRCLHYDNWATIIYWNKVDPHVYDKCIPNHCSKTVVITPNARTIANGIYDTSNWRWDIQRGLVGDGKSCIVEHSKWDNSSDGVNITRPGQGYAASLVRAKLIGADSHTKLDDKYAGVDALTKYRTVSSILSSFPRVLRDAIGAKVLSSVADSYDEVSNDGVADRLWLFSYGEIENTVYPSVGFKNDGDYDAKRSSSIWQGWWLRSPYFSDSTGSVNYTGSFRGGSPVGGDRAVAPGFTLS